jgi:ATP-dependent protease ClpP protease subunit
MPKGNRQQEQQSSNKFWNFVPGTATKPPELLLYGTISSQQSWWGDRVTPAIFNKELAELGDAKEIIVRINSGGGDVFAANAIYTRLKDHDAHITVKVDGWAASAATIIAMAGDTIKIARNGIFMIHDPAMTVWDTFTAEDFTKMADELKIIKQSIVNAYAARSKRKAEEIETLMADETWWTGDEAVENGFCDELMFENTNTVVENASKVVVNAVPMDMSCFRTIPKQLLNLSKTDAQHIETPKNKEGKKMELHELTAQYPELIKEIADTAKAEERQRIKAIKEMEMEGFESIIEDAMFENPKTAEAVAVSIIKEQKKQGSKYLADREADVTDSGMSGVAQGVGTVDEDGKNPYDDAINKLFGKEV